MPWTIAHAAAVLPLRRWPRWLPFCGLAVGSMSPDFGYYTSHFELAQVAHTAPGLLLLCLPSAMVVVLLLRWLHGPLVALLPQPHRGALAPRPSARTLPAGGREWLALVLAVVVAAATHVVWDAFTHHDGFGVAAVPLLREPLFTIGARRFFAYNTLQHASTVFGATCLVVAYIRWLRRAPPPPAGWGGDDGRDALRVALLAACLVIAIAVAVPMAFEVIGPWHGSYRASMIFVRSLIYATSAFVLLATLAALLWARFSPSRQRS